MRDERLMRHSLQIYRLIVLLYPRRFHQRYGEEMLLAFERLLENEPPGPWRRVLLELGPTLVREHFDAAAESVGATLRSNRLRLALRLILAALLPLGGYVVLLGWAVSRQDVVVLTTYFLFVTAGMAFNRGRGWACSAGAITGAVVAVWLVVAITGLTQITNPNIILIAPLLAAAGATIALILSTYVRLMIEGVSWSLRPAA